MASFLAFMCVTPEIASLRTIRSDARHHSTRDALREYRPSVNAV
jgi:hypothetical protein